MNLPTAANKQSSKKQNTNPNATGTRYHPNNQVKADHPKKPSPFSALFKDYRYDGGEITRWFVDAWDQFNTIEEAVDFMVEQVDAKKYRVYCFTADWPAIVDRFIFLRRRLLQGENVAQFAKNLAFGKLIATVGGPENSDFNDLIFQLSVALVVGAGTNLPAFVTKTTINHLGTL